MLESLKVYQGHKAGGYAASGTPYYSASFSNSGNTSVAVVLNAGTGGTNAIVAVELQESDDNSTWSDISGNDTLIAARQSDGTHEAIYYGAQVTPVGAYLRVKATVTNSQFEFGTAVIAVPRRTEARTVATFTR